MCIIDRDIFRSLSVKEKEDSRYNENVSFSEICELLLEAEADVEALDGAGRTTLWAAAAAGHARTLRLLLFWGACVDNMDADGRTVLSVAAAQGTSSRLYTIRV